MSVSTDLFREVFRRWPTGVGVVTSCRLERPHGMVVSSFCSLSGNPPRVMVSIGTMTRMHDIVDESGVFAVSILSHEQIPLFERFAGIDRRFDDDRFFGIATEIAETGVPVLPESLAWVDCRVVARHSGDDYTIFVGEIVAASLGEAADESPLVYFRRQPGTIAVPETERDEVAVIKQNGHLPVG